MTAFVLMAGAVAVVLWSAVRETRQLQTTLNKRLSPARSRPGQTPLFAFGKWGTPLSKMVSMALVAAHISELLKMIEHVSIVNIATALLLFAIAVAAKSGNNADKN